MQSSCNFQGLSKQSLSSLTGVSSFSSNHRSLKYCVLFKVVFKIHFRPFQVILVKQISGKKMGGYFSLILGFWKCLTLEGGKTTFDFFSRKCPNSGIVSEIKYIEFSVTIGGVGSDPNVTFVTFILKASLMWNIKLNYCVWFWWILSVHLIEKNSNLFNPFSSHTQSPFQIIFQTHSTKTTGKWC